MTPEQVARHICSASHARFPDPLEGGDPCAEHLGDAQRLWVLTQPRGAVTLAVLVDLSLRSGVGPTWGMLARMAGDKGSDRRLARTYRALASLSEVPEP